MHFNSSAFMKRAGILCIFTLANFFTPDQTFYRTAGEYFQFEIQSGKLAQHNGNAKAKNVGKKMTDDFTVAFKELGSIALKNNEQVSAVPDNMSKKELLDLTNLRGKAFDDAYRISQVRSLNHLIETFKYESDSGKDESARAFAGRYLPKLYMHLQWFANDSMAIKISIDSTPNSR